MNRRDQFSALHAANDKMVDAGLLLRIIDVDGEPALQCEICHDVDGHMTDCSVLDRISRLARGEASAA